MSELRPEDLTVDHFNHLTPTQAELLALLSEECGEVVQIVGKILRHGLSSCHPDGGFPNYRLLEGEIGDFIAAIRLIASAGMIDMARVEDAADAKLRKVFKYLHHSSPPASEEDMGTGEFVEDGFGSAWEKCKRPECDLRVISRGKAICGHGCHESASEEKVTSDYRCRKCHKVLMAGEDHFLAEANQYVCGPWDYSRKRPTPPKPAATEMPEAVSNAAMKLRHSARYCERDGYPSTASEEREIADALEFWWRSQPAPAAVAMTPELDRLLTLCESLQIASDPQVTSSIHADAKAVRAQASQPQRVKLPKVREALITLRGCIYMQENMDKVIAALAELDAVEKGKP